MIPANLFDFFLCLAPDLLPAAPPLPSPQGREEYARYYQTNPDALKAFQRRRNNGMTLSDRVWNLKEEFRMGIEDSVSAAIAPGVSAQQLSIDVRKYLNEPDLMFRRFRYKDEQGHWKRKWKKRTTDEEGNVRFVDCDKETYANRWTGPGYYKSAYQNAMRLARTEINMAYRMAEQERWKQFDFVVGYEVKTTKNGRHVEDICDRLAGRYPKTFRFVGWHPNCMCYAIPILKTEEEFWEAPESPSPALPAGEGVDGLPDGFRDWVKDNAERIWKATEKGTLPYFLRDNFGEVERVLKEGHHKTGTHKTGRASDKEFSRILANPKADAPALLSEEIKIDAENYCREIGIKRKNITWSEADGGLPNLDGYDENCQSAVVVYEARRRGIDLISLAHSSDKNSISYQLGEDCGLAFIGKNGLKVTPITMPTDKIRMESELKKIVRSNGRYHIGMNFNDSDGHIIVAEKVKGQDVVFYDATDGSTWSLGEIINRSRSVEVLRVDKLLFNHEVLMSVSRPLR